MTASPLTSLSVPVPHVLPIDIRNHPFSEPPSLSTPLPSSPPSRSGRKKSLSAEGTVATMATAFSDNEDVNEGVDASSSSLESHLAGLGLGEHQVDHRHPGTWAAMPATAAATATVTATAPTPPALSVPLAARSIPARPPVAAVLPLLPHPPMPVITCLEDDDDDDDDDDDNDDPQEPQFDLKEQVVDCDDPYGYMVDEEEEEYFPPHLHSDPPSPDFDHNSSSLRRRSILRVVSCPSDLACLNPKKSCWKSLPPPDMLSLSSSCELARKCRAASLGSHPTTTTSSPPSRRRRSVAFGSIHCRSYQQTVGDNPSVSYGPPITLDWDYLELPSMDVDVHEAGKGGRPAPTPRQLLLNYYQRQHVLGWKLGATPLELKHAEREANRLKRQRAVTRALLPLAPLEECIERASRGLLKGRGRRRRTSSDATSGSLY